MGAIIIMLIISIVWCFVGFNQTVDNREYQIPKAEKHQNTAFNKHTQKEEQASEPTEKPKDGKSETEKQIENVKEETTVNEEDNEKEPDAVVDNGTYDSGEDNQDKKEQYCTISIDCHTVNDNLDKLKPEKAGLVPRDGIILAKTQTEIQANETVFDVLKRITRENKIHLEFSKTPAYNSIYIEGINNLYEFDCGQLSGWMYSVNGEFPGYSSSQYKVKNGDDICFLYTCNLGKDIGDTKEFK